MMNCPSCGKELSAQESTAKFCAYCGAPLPAVAAEETNENNGVNTTPNGKDLVKGLLDKLPFPPRVAAIAAAVVLVLILIISVASSGSYMSPVKDFVKLVNHRETDLFKLSSAIGPDFRVKEMKKMYQKSSDDYKEELEDSADAVEDKYDQIEDELGKWKIGFDVKSKEKLDKDDLEDIQDSVDDYYDNYVEQSLDMMEDVLDDEDMLESMADEMDLSKKEAKAYIKACLKYYKSYDKVKVSAAYEIKGKFTFKSKEDDWESKTVRIKVVKINGDWCYAGMDGEVNFLFDEEDEDVSTFVDIFDPFYSNYLFTSGVDF